MNPLLLLDEIDKLGSDYRGDPASALLEVLDSEQNHAFRDHFLETPCDLCRCDVHHHRQHARTPSPGPLLDRMEVIELPSYTDEEKLQIAKGHLLPKQMKEHGLNEAPAAHQRRRPCGTIISRLYPGVRRAPAGAAARQPSAARRPCAFAEDGYKRS